MNRFLSLGLFLVASFSLLPGRAAEPAFTHPGILHSRADLDRMRAMVRAGVQPWARGFEALRAVPQSSLDYVVQGPFQDVRYENGQYEFRRDASAAYNLALVWAITGDARYAAKSLGILRAWAGEMESFDKGDHITAGMGTHKFAAAAEILRHRPDSGWTDADTTAFTRFLARLRPALDKPNLFMNQGGYALMGLTAIAVFTDDLPLYRHALRRATVGDHEDPRKDAALSKTIWPSGQVAEMGRDQTHPQGGLGSLACLAQTAWIQGPDVAGSDLFDAYDRRLLAGFEYLAAHNLGYPVPYEPRDERGRPGLYDALSPTDRGKLSPIFELVYQHYRHRARVPAADLRFTGEARAHLMPEGFSEDFPGFGTLTFSQPEAREPAPPAGPPKPLPPPPAAEASRFPAAQFSATQGVGREYHPSPDGRTALIASNIQEGDSVRYDDFDFGPTPVDTFIASAGSASPVGCKIDVLLDRLDAEPLATLAVGNTGWWSTFETFSVPLRQPVSGRRTLFLRFHGAKHVYKFQCNLAWFRFADAATAAAEKTAQAAQPRFPVVSGARFAAAIAGAAQRTDGAAEITQGPATLSFLSVEFSAGANELSARVRAAPGTKIEVRANDLATAPIATLTLPPEAAAETNDRPLTVSAPLTPAGRALRGNQMLFFTFPAGRPPARLVGFQLDPPPSPSSKDDGFEPIFDGTLRGWDGDPVYWRVENGILVGEITPETLLKRNTFLIWRGGELADFELKLAYRVSGEGNSGVNYRSQELADPKWAMRGYQADLDGKNEYTGQVYEEQGRGFLARRGQSVRLAPGKSPEVTRSLSSSDDLRAQIRPDDWNELHIIARGNRLQHFVNGVLMAEALDDDPAARPASGLLGVQVHVGPPMKIEYRNLRLKCLPRPDETPSPAIPKP